MNKAQHKIILDHYGKDAVLMKFVEELNELSAAISRMKVAEINDDIKLHKKAYFEFLEELADVFEVADRVKLIVDMSYVNHIREKKRDRTLRGIYESRESNKN